MVLDKQEVWFNEPNRCTFPKARKRGHPPVLPTSVGRGNALLLLFASARSRGQAMLFAPGPMDGRLLRGP